MTKRNIFKVLSLFLCFLLFFQQSGFSQVATQIDVAGHLISMRSSLSVDKFRPLHLRYLQYNPSQNNFQLLIDKGTLKKPSMHELEKSSKELLKYFFIGLTLPNDAFWVNLRPDSSDNMIDPLLVQTDIGKILLEADLELKKDTAKATSPHTVEGKKYWDSLYRKAEELFGNQNVTIPTLTRPWIVPDEIIIRESGDSAYIYKATLKVMLEQDYLKNSIAYKFDDQRSKELNEYSAQLIRELIIPKLNREINTAKKYASLRQVYYSLILAQWFKSRNQGLSFSVFVSNLINSRNLMGLTSKEFYSKESYFNAYQNSFKYGEYNFKTPVTTPLGQVIRSYFSGGITGIAPATIPARGALPAVDPTTGAVITVAPSQSSLPNLDSNVGVSIRVNALGEINEVKIDDVAMLPAGNSAGAGAKEQSDSTQQVDGDINIADDGSLEGHETVRKKIQHNIGQIALRQLKERAKREGWSAGKLRYERVQLRRRLANRQNIKLEVDGRNFVVINGVRIIIIDDVNLDGRNQQGHVGVARNVIYLTRRAFEESQLGKNNYLRHEAEELRLWRMWAQRNGVNYTDARRAGGARVARQIHAAANRIAPVDIYGQEIISDYSSPVSISTSYDYKIEEVVVEKISRLSSSSREFRLSNAEIAAISTRMINEYGQKALGITRLALSTEPMIVVKATEPEDGRVVDLNKGARDKLIVLAESLKAKTSDKVQVGVLEAIIHMLLLQERRAEALIKQIRAKAAKHPRWFIAITAALTAAALFVANFEFGKTGERENLPETGIEQIINSVNGNEYYRITPQEAQSLGRDRITLLTMLLEEFSGFGDSHKPETGEDYSGDSGRGRNMIGPNESSAGYAPQVLEGDGYILANISGSISGGEFLISGIYNSLEKGGRFGRRGAVRLEPASDLSVEKTKVKVKVASLSQGRRVRMFNLMNGRVTPQVFNDGALSIDEEGILTVHSNSAPTEIEYEIIRARGNSRIVAPQESSQWLEEEFAHLPAAVRRDLDKAKGASDHKKAYWVQRVLNKYFAYSGLQKVKLNNGTWCGLLGGALEQDGRFYGDCDVLGVYCFIFSRYLGLDSVALVGFVTDSRTPAFLYGANGHLMTAARIGQSWQLFDPTRFVGMDERPLGFSQSTGDIGENRGYLVGGELPGNTQDSQEHPDQINFREFDPVFLVNIISKGNPDGWENGRALNRLKDMAQEEPERIPEIQEAFLRGLIDNPLDEPNQRVSAALDSWLVFVLQDSIEVLGPGVLDESGGLLIPTEASGIDWEGGGTDNFIDIDLANAALKETKVDNPGNYLFSGKSPVEIKKIKFFYGYFDPARNCVVIDIERARAAFKDVVPELSSAERHKVTGFVHAHEIFHQLVQTANVPLGEEEEERLADIFAKKAIGLRLTAEENSLLEGFYNKVSNEGVRKQLNILYDSPEFLLNLRELFGEDALNSIESGQVDALPQGAKGLGRNAVHSGDSESHSVSHEGVYYEVTDIPQICEIIEREVGEGDAITLLSFMWNPPERIGKKELLDRISYHSKGKYSAREKYNGFGAILSIRRKGAGKEYTLTITETNKLSAFGGVDAPWSKPKDPQGDTVSLHATSFDSVMAIIEYGFYALPERVVFNSQAMGADQDYGNTVVVFDLPNEDIVTDENKNGRVLNIALAFSSDKVGARLPEELRKKINSLPNSSLQKKTLLAADEAGLLIRVDNVRINVSETLRINREQLGKGLITPGEYQKLEEALLVLQAKQRKSPPAKRKTDAGGKKDAEVTISHLKKEQAIAVVQDVIRKELAARKSGRSLSAQEKLKIILGHSVMSFPEAQDFRREVLMSQGILDAIKSGRVELWNFIDAVEGRYRQEAVIVVLLDEITDGLIQNYGLSNDRNINGLQEPGAGPGGGPIIEGPNNQVRKARELIAQGNAQYARIELEKAIEAYEMIIEVNGNMPEDTLGYQLYQAARANITVARGLLNGLNDGSYSKEAGNSGSAPERNVPGGIDFRSLPIVSQAVYNIRVNNSPSLSMHLSNLDLQKEWSEIENMVASGIIPSAERIKEYLQALCLKGAGQRDLAKVADCISNILRQEEEYCCKTEAALRDIIVILEVNSSAAELREAFLGKEILKGSI